MTDNETKILLTIIIAITIGGFTTCVNEHSLKIACIKVTGTKNCDKK